MSDDRIETVGIHGYAKIEELLLDADNPRLVSSKGGETQEELALAIEMSHDSIVVAESIARWGYFANEPLIVLPKREDGHYVVVEGNRRAVALMGLAYPRVRSGFFDSHKWDLLAKNGGVTPQQEVPVVIIERREQVASIIGFRHISGILDWTPFAQLAYVADLVDTHGFDFESVASMIGKRRQDVSELYRNFKIAKRSVGYFETAGLEDAFSLLTVAMGSPHIREFMGAPSGTKVERGQSPIPSDHEPELKEVLTWIFGSSDGDRVIQESRNISALGKVIKNPIGLKSLRDGSSLKVAQAAIEEKGLDPKERITRRLTTAINALKGASEDIGEFAADKEVVALLNLAREEINGLASFVELKD